MTRPDPARPIPKAGRREATRVALIAAAHAVARNGRGDPLDPAVVTAEVGTSRPLFYAHFPTRGDFVEAILSSIHEDAEPAPLPVDDGPRAAALALFAGLAAPLDRHAALARTVIPASHLPGPLAVARSRRRAAAVARIARLLPTGLALRDERAAFLMDAFLGIQLAWSKALTAESLADRVRRDLGWAIDGVLASAGVASDPSARPDQDPSTPPTEEVS